jgi:hypothetical protein
MRHYVAWLGHHSHSARGLILTDFLSGGAFSEAVHPFWAIACAAAMASGPRSLRSRFPLPMTFSVPVTWFSLEDLQEVRRRFTRHLQKRSLVWVIRLSWKRNHYRFGWRSVFQTRSRPSEFKLSALQRKAEVQFGDGVVFVIEMVLLKMFRWGIDFAICLLPVAFVCWVENVLLRIL